MFSIAQMIFYEADILVTIEKTIHHELFWRIVLALAELGISYLLGTMTQKMIMKLSRKVTDKGVMTFFGSAANIVIKVSGVVIALDQLGVSMNLIISTLSAAGLGISLALKDNMASVASGMQILLTKPFKVGDYIGVNGREGFVISIELTYTVLQTVEDNTVILPNDKAIFKSIINFSEKNDRLLLVEYPCRKEEIPSVRKMLLKAANQSSLVLPGPAPDIWIKDWYYNGATLQIAVYTRPEDYWNASTQINNQIELLLEQQQKAEPEVQPAKQSSAAKPAGSQHPDEKNSADHDERAP